MNHRRLGRVELTHWPKRARHLTVPFREATRNAAEGSRNSTDLRLRGPLDHNRCPGNPRRAASLEMSSQSTTRCCVMNLTTAIGSVAALCTTAAYIPQLRKCWQTASAGDLSLRTFSVLATGVALWIVYGVALGDAVIIAANTITLVLLGGILFFKLRDQQPQDAEGSRQTRDSLLRSEDRYRTVVESARDYAIFTTDQGGRIVDWYPGGNGGGNGAGCPLA
jgi:MtN3 and saliva related transmembrane protein